MKKIFTIIALLLLTSYFAFSQGITYPATSYQLSDDKTILLSWNGNETVIDLTKDTAFANVVRIETLAFKNNSRITEVVIPNTVTSIADATFSNCSNLKKCTLSENLTELPDALFLACAKLTTVNIPAGLTKVGNNVFNNCRALGNITLPNTVSHIGDAAFSQCKGFSTFTFPTSLQNLGQNAFDGCSNLTAFTNTLPTGVTVIKPYTFHDCKALTAITVSNAVVEIGEAAFKNTTALGDFMFPNQLKKIGKEAFENSGIVSANMPNTITSLGNSIFMGCENLATTHFPENSLVTTIPVEMYRYCSALTSFTFPPNVHTISSVAFLGCSGGAFYGTLTLPEGIKQIVGGSIFEGTGMTKLILPKTFKAPLKNDYFCRTLEEVVVHPDNAELCSIDGVVFSKDKKTLYFYPSNKSNTEYTVPSTVTKIYPVMKPGANYTIPASVNEIVGGAFSRNQNLEEITIPNNVKVIRYAAFEFLAKVKTINLPTSLSKIETYAFHFSPNLSIINNMPESFPLGEHLGHHSFAVTKIKSIKIPEGITRMRGVCFSECKELESVVIPSTMKDMGYKEFVNCTALKEIQCKAVNPPILRDNDAFDGVPQESVVLRVPIGSRYAYQTSNSQWQNFHIIQEKDYLDSKIWFQPITTKGTNVNFTLEGSKVGKLSVDWGNNNVVAGTDGNGYAVQGGGLTNTITGQLVGTPQGSPAVNTVRILEYGSEKNIINCINFNGQKLLQFNTENCPTLERLNINNTEVKLWDISKNTNLKELWCTDNKFTVLSSLEKNTLLEQLHCQNNKLSILQIVNNGNIKVLEAQNNLLKTLDLSAQGSLVQLNISNNKLTQLQLPVGITFENANVANNALPMSMLPNKTSGTSAANFIYSPQQRYALPKSEYSTSDVIDLSSQNNLLGVETTPQTTTYVWKDAATDAVLTSVSSSIKSADYEVISEGVFRFKRAFPQGVYCEMSSPAYPNLKSFEGTRTRAGEDTAYRSNPVPIRLSESDYFITVWDTKQVSETNKQILFPGIGDRFTVVWEDVNNPTNHGTMEASGYIDTPAILNVFPTPGKYRLKVTPGIGTFTGFRMDGCSATIPPTLMSVEQWGNINWERLDTAFEGALNMDVVATDIPNLSNVTTLSKMFKGCKKLEYNASIGNWDTSNIVDMGEMFHDATNFNQNIGNWDTSSVKTITQMFHGASSFNQYIGDWNTSSFEAGALFMTFREATHFNQNINTKVVNAGTPQQYIAWDVKNATNMDYLFYKATDFNQPLSNWDVSKVTTMSAMFRDCSNFNQDINKKEVTIDGNTYTAWDTKSVTSMMYMFRNASKFNHSISNWDVAKVTTFAGMFNGASMFNQPLGNWNTSKALDMAKMFSVAVAFDQELNTKQVTVDGKTYTAWDTKNVTNMSSMFAGATVFNSDISKWNVSKVTAFDNIFSSVKQFNQDISKKEVTIGGNTYTAWNTAEATTFYGMFYLAQAFNQDIRNWNTGKVQTMKFMFADATNFNYSLGNWDISSVTDMAGMITSPNFSQENYDSSLIGWAAQEVQNGVPVGVNQFYCQGRNAHLVLEGKGWVFSDKGVSASCPATLPGIKVEQPEPFTIQITTADAKVDYNGSTTITFTFRGGTPPYSVTYKGTTHVVNNTAAADQVPTGSIDINSGALTLTTIYDDKNTDLAFADAGSCEYTVSAATVIVEENKLPLQFNLVGTKVCQGGTAKVSLEGSEADVSYQLQTTDGTNIGAAVAGTGHEIDFTITGGTDITATTDVQVLATRFGVSSLMANPATVLYVGAIKTDCEFLPAAACKGSATTIQMNASQAGVFYQLTTESGNNVSSGRGTGGTVYFNSGSIVATTVYKVKAKVLGAVGCEATLPDIKVTVNEPPVFEVSTSDVRCFNGNTGSLTVTPKSGGGLPFTYMLINIKTFETVKSAPQNNTNPYTFTGLKKGNYTVRVIDANGCLKNN